MTNEKFTPGEWNISDCRETPDAVYDYSIVDKDGWCIAHIENCNLEEQEANASLIAAAPEMYRMLKYLADGVRFGGIQHTDRSLAAEIENLLKKARGEE